MDIHQVCIFPVSWKRLESMIHGWRPSCALMLSSPTVFVPITLDTFFQTRETALLARIEQVMGKPIARGVPIPIVDEMPQDYQEDEEDGA